MNENESGAQFAARLHLQTVELQAVVILNQQKEIDRLNAQLIEKVSESTKLRQQLAALEESMSRLIAPKN
jgi:uncharacterized coiled-coil protein SlyX